MVTISSTAGLEGGEFTSAYAASKFGVEGWMESLAPEIAPFGIRTMLVEPGFFRTELLTPESTKYAASSIEDYAERTEQTVTAWKGMNGQQGGDPEARRCAGLPRRSTRSRRCVRCWRRRGRRVREKGQQPPRPSQRLPRPVQQPRPRFGLILSNQFNLEAEQPIEQPRDWPTNAPIHTSVDSGQSRWLHRELLLATRNASVVTTMNEPTAWPICLSPTTPKRGYIGTRLDKSLAATPVTPSPVPGSGRRGPTATVTATRPGPDR